ncbi:MFS-type transporter cnsO [Physcia stellaris]|nr:MFS-type transporter cnsO [Physcia stellaris]
MPSRKRLRTLAESIAAEMRQNNYERSLSPFNEDVDVPHYFRRRNSAEFREIHAMVFENPEPFLPFRQSTRRAQESPPLSPRSCPVPEGLSSEAGGVGRKSESKGRSASDPIVIDDDEEEETCLRDGDQRLDNRTDGNTRTRQSDISNSETIRSSRSDSLSTLNKCPKSRGKNSIYEELDLISRALVEGDSYRSSCSEDGDDIATPEMSPASTHDWERWLHEPYSHSLDGLFGAVSHEGFFSDHEQEFALPGKQDEPVDEAKFEDIGARSWSNYENVYFLKEDDALFEYIDGLSDIDEFENLGEYNRKSAQNDHEDTATISATTPALTRGNSPQPIKATRQVAFAVDTTEEEEEACEYEQLRCDHSQIGRKVL